MKETTRIHIAKITYDIEVDAKKSLQAYIKDLERYANDKELLEDIEIRITELLAERGVAKNGVVAVEDVLAVRTTLGEPEEFADDSLADSNHSESSFTRKLYRDTDSAILGGVLAGIAKFFGIQTLWARGIFVVLVLLTAFFPLLLVYVILWAIIPPAKSAAQKLQMSGKPTTLSHIKEISLSDQDNERAESARRFIGFSAGIINLLLAIGALLITAGSGFILGIQNSMRFFDAHAPIDYGPQWPYIVAYGLAIASGILLAALFSLLAYACFSRTFTKRLGITMTVIVLAGLVSFGTAVGLVAYREYYMSEEIDRAMETKSVTLPDNFSSVKSLSTAFNSANVTYVVDDTNPRMEYRAVAGTKAPSLTVNNAKATISYDGADYPDYSKARTKITVYGPRLEQIESDSTFVTYEGGSGTLNVITKGWASVIMNEGTYDTLRADLAERSSLSAAGAAVREAQVSLRGSAQSVELGVVRTVGIVQSESCPVESKAMISVADVTSGSITFNGSVESLKNFESGCLEFFVTSTQDQE